MAFNPITEVHLLSVPWDYTNKNQPYYANRSDQLAFMNTKIVRTETQFTYQRKDNVLRINAHIDELWSINYVMYRNRNFSNRRFFCFVTDMKYVNDGLTELTLKTDVVQTWLLDCTLKESFVIREHVATDTIGQHIVEEGLEIGDYKIRDMVYTDEIADISYVVALSDVMLLGEEVSIGNIYSGTFSGLTYYAFTSSNLTSMKALINNYITNGKGDAIAFIFTIPTALLPVTNGVIPSGTNASGVNVNVTPNYNDLDGYVPKNNKLFTYPYNFLYATNQQGGHAVFKYENFNNKDMTNFGIMGHVAPNPTLSLVPNGYCGDIYSLEYGLSMGGFPLCSWNNDTFGAWLSQNYPTVAMGFLGGATSTFVGAVTGNVGAVVGGVQGAFNQMAKIWQQAIQPDQAKGNVNGGGLNIALGEMRYKICKMTIKRSYAERIDEYFNMYGYMVNEVKVPNISARPVWNYVLTNDVNIVGNIPNNDMMELKSIFNNGVTFWRSANNIGNYSMTNKFSGAE